MLVRVLIAMGSTTPLRSAMPIAPPFRTRRFLTQMTAARFGSAPRQARERVRLRAMGVVCHFVGSSPPSLCTGRMLMHGAHNRLPASIHVDVFNGDGLFAATAVTC